MISTLASSISVLAISSICLWLMERFATFSSKSIFSPTRSSIIAARTRISFQSITLTPQTFFVRWRPIYKFSSTVNSSMTLSSW